MIARGLVSAAVLSALMLSSLMLSSVASAQSCDGGRVRVSGFCCWPGQTWSGAACAGPPHCPAGMAEDGLSCVGAPSAAPLMTPSTPTGTLIRPMTPSTPLGMTAPRQAIQGTTATSVDGWPELPRARPDGIMNPVLRRGTDDGLVFGGLITFGVGYVVGLFMGIADSVSTNCGQYSSRPPTECGSGGLALIPLAGAALSTTGGSGRSNFAFGVGLGAPMGVVQLIGFWIFLHGIAGSTLDIDEAHVDLGSGASLRIEMSAPSSDAGLSAVVSF